MGEEGKYTSQNIVPRIKESTRLLNHNAVGLALVVANTQKRGYYGKIRSLVEAPVFDMIANLVRMHTMYMLPDAATHAELRRHVQKVQARMPPTGLLLHSIHALSHALVHAIPFADIVHCTAYNWTTNPCPMEMLPMLIATIISNTFDWVLWLMLGVFAELFEIPAIQADELELLFSNKDYSVLTKHTGPLCEWLETFGFSDGSGGERAGDVIYQKLRVSAMARSAVYISTMSSGDAELASDDLACVIGTDKFQGSSFRAHGLAPPPAGEERKVAKHVAKIMFDKYESRLSGACNITTADAVEIMLICYINKPMHFPKFGTMPPCCGVLACCGIQNENVAMHKVAEKCGMRNVRASRSMYAVNFTSCVPLPKAKYLQHTHKNNKDHVYTNSKIISEALPKRHTVLILIEPKISANLNVMSEETLALEYAVLETEKQALQCTDTESHHFRYSLLRRSHNSLQIRTRLGCRKA